MDNLEDLRIIDALLQEYDRRATPTNKMGRLAFKRIVVMYTVWYFGICLVSSNQSN